MAPTLENGGFWEDSHQFSSIFVDFRGSSSRSEWKRGPEELYRSLTDATEDSEFAVRHYAKAVGSRRRPFEAPWLKAAVRHPELFQGWRSRGHLKPFEAYFGCTSWPFPLETGDFAAISDETIWYFHVFVLEK